MESTWTHVINFGMNKDKNDLVNPRGRSTQGVYFYCFQCITFIILIANLTACSSLLPSFSFAFACSHHLPHYL
jgi:hypothetical protein